MNKIRVIDLLNKIAKGEEVPLIKYRDKIFHWNKEKDGFEDKDGMNTLYEMDFSELNDEIEIIEEDKKIVKIDVAWQNAFDEQVQQDCVKIILNKINEIIDKVNELEEK